MNNSNKFYTKGMYNRYDKNHKERDKLDYYATPPAEVTNILKTLNIDFNEQVILEPCCGGGHMVHGIHQYLEEKQYTTSIIATDIHDHYKPYQFDYMVGDFYDFLNDDYPLLINNNIDWVIMNPPYSTIEPFTIRALELANKGVIMLARLQFLEDKNRYENILKSNPPNDIYVYVDRINCWKGGKPVQGASAQAYAWFVWNFEKIDKTPQLHWLRRAK